MLLVIKIERVFANLFYTENLKIVLQIVPCNLHKWSEFGSMYYSIEQGFATCMLQ